MNNRKSVVIPSVCCILLAVITACTAANSTPTSTVLPPNPTPLEIPTQPQAFPTPIIISVAPTITNLPPTAISPTEPAVPSATSAASSNPALLSVILVPESQKLSVHLEPGETSPIVSSFDPNARGIIPTGQSKVLGDKTWVEIHLAGDKSGWVNGYFLTQEMGPEAFCQDIRVPQLLEALGKALQEKNGDALKSLVSPLHGLTIHYYHTGSAINYTPDEAGWVFKSTFSANWGHHPASDAEVKGTFVNVVLPDLLDAFDKQPQQSCMQIVTGPINYNASLPFEYSNILHYSVYKPGSAGVDLDWRTWIVGIEYVEGAPYLFSLHQFFWEP